MSHDESDTYGFMAVLEDGRRFLTVKGYREHYAWVHAQGGAK